jgi:hypothetical protein
MDRTNEKGSADGGHLSSAPSLYTWTLEPLLLSWVATTMALIAEIETPRSQERRQRLLEMAACCRSLAQEITAKGDDHEH